MRKRAPRSFIEGKVGNYPRQGASESEEEYAARKGKWMARRAGVLGAAVEGGVPAVVDNDTRQAALRGSEAEVRAIAADVARSDAILGATPDWLHTVDGHRKLMLALGSKQFRDNVLEALKPGPRCEACGRGGYNRHAMNTFAKVTKLASPAIEVNVAIQALFAEVGVGSYEELRSMVEVARAGGEEKDPESVYRQAKLFCDEYRKARGKSELIDPDLAEVVSEAR